MGTLRLAEVVGLGKARSGRKPYNGDPGYVCSRRNDINREWVVIYDAQQCPGQFDDSDGRWVAMCMKHETICNSASLKSARPFLKFPEFCEECMADCGDEK